MHALLEKTKERKREDERLFEKRLVAELKAPAPPPLRDPSPPSARPAVSCPCNRASRAVRRRAVRLSAGNGAGGGGGDGAVDGEVRHGRVQSAAACQQEVGGGAEGQGRGGGAQGGQEGRAHRLLRLHVPRHQRCHRRCPPRPRARAPRAPCHHEHPLGERLGRRVSRAPLGRDARDALSQARPHVAPRRPRTREARRAGESTLPSGTSGSSLGAPRRRRRRRRRAQRRGGGGRRTVRAR